VKDNGIGIRAEMMPHIFDLFQQADRLPGRVAEGLGIGLGLVRQLVELHGGTVTVSSAGPGQGSEFVVRFPARLEGAVPSGQPTANERQVRPLRVLITDDNVDSAESMALLLRLEGHEVRTAHDGAQALDVARRFHPQVAFLDVALPRGMDGYELARQLRRQEGTEHTLLVAMTGFGSADDVARARAAGMDHHLTKPADLDLVQKLLASRR
jgi:CheY-like chemotaxis protein